METRHNNVILFCSVALFAFVQIAMLVLLIMNMPSREERIEIHKQALTAFFEENTLLINE